MNKYKNIYVMCPASTKTGGTELLHQLVNALYDIGINASIVYVTVDGNASVSAPNDAFKKYIHNKPLAVQDIEDSKENMLIIPEVYYKYTLNFSRIYKSIWWLSVDFFLQESSFRDRMRIKGFLSALKNFFLGRLHNKMNYILNVDLHLCQSYYAMDFLRKNGIEGNKIRYLSDYINDEYLNGLDENVQIDKEDLVLYNPKKVLKFTKKLISTSKELKWIPIENMTNDQVKSLMRKSKVYIDFGNHPGKDRIPREAAISGCCVITGKRGAAAFEEDVPIPDKYKFDEKLSPITEIINCIKHCINDYDEVSRDYDSYRAFIVQEKKRFYTDVKNIFLYND